MRTKMARGSALAAALPGILVGLCAVGLTACGVALLAEGTGEDALTLHSPADLDHGVAAAFVALGLVVLVWWLFSLLAGIIAVLLCRGGHHLAANRAARCSPVFMREFTAALLGAQLLVVPAAQAAGHEPVTVSSTGIYPATVSTLAVPATGIELPAASWSSRDLPSPAWSPERPAAPMNRLMGQQNRTAAGANSIVVQEGDSLWSIAARVAGPGATDAEIAREWPRWYQTNRTAIGPNPDLLDIGTVLSPPRAEQDLNRE